MLASHVAGFASTHRRMVAEYRRFDRSWKGYCTALAALGIHDTAANRHMLSERLEELDESKTELTDVFEKYLAIAGEALRPYIRNEKEKSA